MSQLNRRVLVQVAVGMAISPFALAQSAASAPASSPNTNPKKAPAKPAVPSAAAWMDKWISQWKSDGKAVSGLLYLGRFADPTYFVTKEISWKPDASQDASLPTVTVPAGFVTDFASIPRAFWSLLRPDGEYAYAAVIHDYLYWNQNLTREQSDLIFKLAMQDFKIDDFTVGSIHKAVRAGGKSAWNQNAALKKRGEERIIKSDSYPTDPRVKWKDFKKNTDVFQA